MTCPFCRSENPETAQRCSTCGQVLAAAPAIGSVIASRYEILGFLGSGGMGTVFKARDRKLAETVAIKVLRADPSDAPDLATRFRSEIKLAWKVRHRNVCGIHEYGEDGNLLYISMELVEGRNFRQLLREQGALLWEDAYDVALQVAEGLQAIHEAGVIHRDLKTANIIRDERGLVRLLDFGIAKVWGDDSGGGVTGTGKVVGSPEYMSPEQVKGGKVDFRSDIYALGIVTFEIFTGRVPFRAETPVATMLKHLQAQPPLEGPDAAQLPAALVPVLRKALAKDPSQRYATCAQIVAALHEAQAMLAHQVTDTVAGGPAAAGKGSLAEAAVRPAVVPGSGAGLGSATPTRSPHARLLVPSLVRALRHPDPKLRTDAAHALGSVGPQASEAVPALLDALKDEAWTVREQAAQALELVGADSAEAASALPDAQREADSRVRTAATAVVARLTPQAPAAPASATAAAGPPQGPIAPDTGPRSEGAPPPPATAAAPTETAVQAVVLQERLEERSPSLRWTALAGAVIVVAAWALYVWVTGNRGSGSATTPSSTLSPTAPPSTQSPVIIAEVSVPSMAPTTATAPTTSPAPDRTVMTRRPVGTRPTTVATLAAAPPATLPPPTTTLSAPTAAPTPVEAPPETMPLPTPTPATPAERRPLQLEPTCERCPTPEYPPIAERRRIEGTVRLKVHVDSSGKVVEAQVVSGVELLTEQAVKAVMKWTYRPGTRDGVPVDFWIPVSVRFALDK